MSGHSHAKTIMHKKGAADAKRSQVFSKLAKELTLVAKDGGEDPIANPRLRTIIDKAKASNMPSDNIDRAIKKATGEDAKLIQEILLEAYGPGNIALLISAITDNRNRTIGEIKQILQKYQGKMVEGGAMRWLFEHKGVVTVEPKESTPSSREELEFLAIEAGAEDLHWQGDMLDIYTDPSNLASLKQKLEEKEVRTRSSLDWVPKDRTRMNQSHHEAAERLFEALQEQDDVQDIYSNL